MQPLLAPLVGDASTVTIIGLCKNAGKTTTLCRLLEELGDEPVALTSVGRDGERTDVVTGTEKPEIWVRKGTLFATARGLRLLCDVTTSVEYVTDVMTPLGPVVIFRALSDGFIQLAGPSSTAQLPPLSRRFRELGARRVLIDGAAGRKSLAGAGSDGCAILCAGASMDGGIPEITAETAHTCTLFASRRPECPELCAALESVNERFALFTPDGQPLALEMNNSGQPVWGMIPKEPCVLWVNGGVTTPMVRALSQRGAPITVAVPDATHLLSDRSSTSVFRRRGGNFIVRQPLRIAAVCANPWSARGRHVDGPELLAALHGALELPVINVKEGIRYEA